MSNEEINRELIMKLGHVNNGKFDKGNWETQDVVDFIKLLLSDSAAKGSE